ncbi:hypothetical protein RJT34_12831 [Clitoria ternatea]|uniref:Uncharacterized protein n=1 Tax=Clitoria ternatea TaxID=43366 RepID=A0AAN9PLA7_CLITE
MVMVVGWLYDGLRFAVGCWRKVVWVGEGYSGDRWRKRMVRVEDGDMGKKPKASGLHWEIGTQAAIIKRSKNKILALKDDFNNWLYDDLGIKNIISLYFNKLFNEEAVMSNLQNTSIHGARLSPEEAITVSITPSIDEIKNALLSMGNFKNPGNIKGINKV